MMKDQTSGNPRLQMVRILVSGLAVFTTIPGVASFEVLPAAAQEVSAPSLKNPNSSPARQPVLVELFTSEGCSDCPAADALLARLDATQFVAGAEAIVLSEHVTYWNYLGWSDPFSFEAMSRRQARYASRFGLDQVYTPQAVVDGAAEVLGSDSAALSHAIAGAAQKEKPELRIEGANWTENTIGFAVKAAEGLHGVLTVALAEDATHSIVGRGENAGRTLQHVAVVRVIKTMGQNKRNKTQVTLDLGNSKGLAGHAFRLVALMTDGEGGRVLAVAEVPVTRP
jgi:hypothetical protein